MKYELYLIKTTTIILDTNINLNNVSQKDCDKIDEIINNDNYSIKLDVNSSKWIIDDLEEIEDDSNDNSFITINFQFN